MTLAHARVADERHIVVALQELQCGNLFDESAGDARLDLSVEVGKRPHVGKFAILMACRFRCGLACHLGVDELEHGSP